jgi:hypothetical protein
MAFPVNDVPKFNTIVPSTKKKITYRPFTVAEQKGLLMAAESDKDSMTLAMKSAVDACTFGAINMENIPNFDLEYLFLQIRAKSIGESIELVLTCQHCGMKDDYVLNITDVNVKENPDHSKKIMLASNLGLTMCYPTTEQVNYLTLNYNTDTVFDTLLDCIETVFTDEEVTNTADESRESLVEFIDSLTGQQMDMIEHFFKTIPVLKHEFEHNCSKCGKPSLFSMIGLESFFL